MRRSAPATRRRRGVALVTAMALLALSAAVLAGSFAAAGAATRAARSTRSAAEADATARYALASVLAQADAECEGLEVGTWRARELTDLELDAAGPGASGRLQVQRLQPRLYGLVVDVRIGAAGMLARRRLRILLERPLGDTTASPMERSASPLRPIAQWSVADLY